MSALIPPPGPPRAAELPRVAERVLDNGLRVIAFAQRALPLVAAQLAVRAGGAREPERDAGLAALAAALLTQGTSRRDASGFADAVDALGARLDASAGYDATVLGVSATTPSFPAAFDLLGEALRAPAFDPAEVARVREKSISDLDLAYSNPSALARLVAQRAVYGDAPYGHPLAGTAATLAGLDRDAVAAFHAAGYRPEDAVLVIGGDLDAEAAFAHAQRVLGGWRAGGEALPERPAPAPPAPRDRVVVVDRPDAGRTALVAGRLALARRDPDYAAAVVATAVLSGYGGRLNQEIRVRRGLSYGAGASLVARRERGALFAATLVDHARVAEASAVTLEVLRGLASAPPDEAALRPRKATVSGGFARGIETIDGIAGMLLDLALAGIPLAELAAWLPSVEAVTSADVARVARRCAASDLALVLVGRAASFADALRAAHAEVAVVPYAELELGSPSLRAAA